MWRKVIDISNYLFGGLFNIGLAVGLLVVAFFVTTWAFDLGLTVFDDDSYMQGEPVYVTLDIPADAGAMDIARILRENELIGNEWIFYLESQLNGSANHFISGRFELNTGMSAAQIMFILQSPYHAIEVEGQVRLVEGLTNRQIAVIAAELGYFSADDFLYYAENGIFNHEFLQTVSERPNRLEGFLFPDTYNLPANTTPRDLIVRQLNRFEYLFDAEKQTQLERLYYTLGWQPTLEELIIIASIIEVEAVIIEERPRVASVIYNRLREGMNLEMITTVSYAANRRQDMITQADRNIDSPYNTFNRPGLPIGAISNPGAVAIEAALNPTNTNYLFMLKLDDGSHIFTQTREEYNAARAMIAANEAE